jgi:sugar phosphate isomerase/epimerase
MDLNLQAQQHPQEEVAGIVLRNFEQELAWLKEHGYDSFQFRDTIPEETIEEQTPSRWSMEQARDVFDALLASRGSIHTVIAELALCPPQAIGT